MAKIPKGKKPEDALVKKASSLLPSDFDGLDLDPKDFLFVASYCSNGFKSGDAARVAGWKGKTQGDFSAHGYRLLKKESINLAIKRFIDSIIKPFKDKLEYEVLEAYYKRATYRISDFFNSNGTVKPLSEIPEEFICCIDGIEKKYFGKDADRSVVTYQLPNRDNALMMLYKFATGVEGIDPKTPTEARENLRNIFQKALSESDAETKMSKRTTVTIEEEYKNSYKHKAAGRPKKVPHTIEVQKIVKDR
jgi:hypothetical protein